jgi:hypothetical protein
MMTLATLKAEERRRTTKILLLMKIVHTMALLALLPNQERVRPEKVRTTSTLPKTTPADQVVANEQISE